MGCIVTRLSALLIAMPTITFAGWQVATSDFSSNSAPFIPGMQHQRALTPTRGPDVERRVVDVPAEPFFQRGTSKQIYSYGGAIPAETESPTRVEMASATSNWSEPVYAQPSMGPQPIPPSATAAVRAPAVVVSQPAETVAWGQSNATYATATYPSSAPVAAIKPWDQPPSRRASVTVAHQYVAYQPPPPPPADPYSKSNLQSYADNRRGPFPMPVAQGPLPRQEVVALVPYRGVDRSYYYSRPMSSLFAISVSGSLKENIVRIMSRYHWKVIWKADYDFNFDGRVTGTSLAQVMEKLLKPFPLQGVMYTANRTMTVLPRKV